MKKGFLQVGKITAPHALKGDVRFEMWCDGVDFLNRFPTLYFDDKGASPIKVTACRQLGNMALLSLEGVDDVDAARALRNKVLYIKRADADLPDGFWFIEELKGCEAYDADDGRLYGVITDVFETGANDVWQISRDGADYLVPAIKSVVASVDIDSGRVEIRPMKGIF